MAGKTVLNFPEITELKSTDMLYVIRESDGATRDKKAKTGAVIGAGLTGTYKLLSGGVVSEETSPDMSFKVSAGSAVINGIFTSWDELSSGTITTPVSNIRLDYIVINDDATLSVVAGTPSATPVFPSVASDQLIIGALVVKSATTSLNDYQEIFNFLNPTSLLPNLYINTAYTATNKLHNNVIIDLTGLITGTLECHGNSFIINYTNNGSDASSGEITVSRDFGYSSDIGYTLYNAKGNGLIGTNGLFYGNYPNQLPYISRSGSNSSGGLTLKAYNVFINSISCKGGNAIENGVTALNFQSGKFSVGASGGNGGNGASVTITAVGEVLLITSINVSGGVGKNGANVSSGTVGNLGGGGGNGGTPGNVTITATNIQVDGSITVSAGTAGTAGTGTGGSNNNANGSAGITPSNGTVTQTEYNFTTGLPNTYGDWIKPIGISK